MNNIKLFFYSLLLLSTTSFAQSYAPPAGQPGTTAMHKDSSAFVAWATGIEVKRGYVQLSDTTKQHEGSNYATFGDPAIVLGKPSGSTTDAVSLGDGGWAILTFDGVIKNEQGWDFAVFENAVTDDFLELGFVEVSSDGEHFFRFPAHTEVPFTTQINGFGSTDCRYIHNFAGKYKVGFGTPFDLDDLPDTTLLDKNAVRYVKIIDVVGSIDSQYASYDAYGNIVNDPFPSPFYSSGFDLTGIGAIHFEQDTSLAVNKLTTTAFKVYPTILDDHLTIQSSIHFEYQLFSITGDLIDHGTGFSGETTLDIHSLKSGMYILVVEGEKERKVVRLVK